MEMKKVFLRGRSMHPFLREGDILWIREGSLKEIKRGSIVVYKRDGRSIVHRVIKILYGSKEPIFITKGDNSSIPDDPVYPHQIVGRVVMRLRKGTFTPITRRREFISMILSKIYLRIRGLLSPVLSLYITLLSPFLHFRIISLHHNERFLAVVNGKVIGSLEGSDIWVHPLFRKTKAMKMLTETIRRKR